MNRTRIKIQSGKIVAGADNLKRMIRHSEDGEYALEKKKWSGAKTWEQIKTIQGVVIPGISNYTGETIQEVKRRLKLDYGEVEYFEKDGETYVELKSYASYTKTQMREHIDKVLHHAEMDLGFVIDLETRQKLQVEESSGVSSPDTVTDAYRC